MTVAAVVLAAGASRRLGRPKQLLEYRGLTLLDAVLGTARAAGLDQVLVTVGAAAAEVRARVDLTAVEVVPVPDSGEGCGASLRTALTRLREGTEGIVVLLGDQPGVTVAAIDALLASASGSSVGACRYDDGLGHPLWFGRTLFPTLAGLHGDKAIWKVVDSRDDLVEAPVPGPAPRDVDTWDDYQALLRDDARAGRR
jgi:molybdenum cofactor cytidylyltransferase